MSDASTTLVTSEIYEPNYLVFEKLLKADAPLSIRELGLDLKYDKLNRSLHVIIENGYGKQAPGRGFRVSINKAGRDYWKRLKTGDFTIIPTQPSKKYSKKSPVVAVPVPVSMHDDIAAAFIKEQSLPVAFNGAMNTCFSSIEQIIADNLSDFTVVEKPKTDLDKHNAKLYTSIQSIVKLCEVIHGQAESENS